MLCIPYSGDMFNCVNGLLKSDLGQVLCRVADIMASTLKCFTEAGPSLPWKVVFFDLEGSSREGLWNVEDREGCPLGQSSCPSPSGESTLQSLR